MTKLAIITPWPQERTGIADYAYDLVLGLADAGADVDVFTTSKDRPDVPDSVQVFDLERFSGKGNYDNVVYQMGNNSDFHADMTAVLFEHPGVVHLHDLSLHHLIAFFLFRGDTEQYYRVLSYWYGVEVMRDVRRYNETTGAGFWDSKRVSEVPFFDPVLNQATACIVHSQYAQKTIAGRFPHLATFVLPQLYRNTLPADYNPDKPVFEIGVFGIVQTHKHVDIVLNSIAECKEAGCKLHLHIGGSLEVGCEHLPKIAERLGIQDCVTFHGRLSAERFQSLMQEVDMCVSLRYPTMGETSAVVSRAVQLGLPTIVNDVGWYAELPECVVKLPTRTDAMQSSLTEKIQRTVLDQQSRNQWRNECMRLARGSYSYAAVAADYLQLVERLSVVPHGNSSNRRRSAA